MQSLQFQLLIQAELMSKTNFYEKLRNAPRPVVVDFWAPWCGPCRSIGPVIEKLGNEYSGRVDVWKVNTDQEPELMRSLRIYGIPTVIAFHGSQEVMRHTGSAPAQVLQPLFETALSGNKSALVSHTPLQRYFRIGASLVLFVAAILNGLSGVYWLLVGAGMLLMFSGVYDCCPVYRMVSTRLIEIFKRDPSQT